MPVYLGRERVCSQSKCRNMSSPHLTKLGPKVAVSDGQMVFSAHSFSRLREQGLGPEGVFQSGNGRRWMPFHARLLAWWLPGWLSPQVLGKRGVPHPLIREHAASSQVTSLSVFGVNEGCQSQCVQALLPGWWLFVLIRVCCHALSNVHIITH